MGKRKIDPPTGTVNRIPGWQKALLDEHVTGLPGLLVRHALDAASAAERSEQGKRNAVGRHEENNKIKEIAREYYLSNRQSYKSQKEAARDLANQFDKIAFGTFKNWVSKWSKE
jgi:hypothetical protein